VKIPAPGAPLMKQTQRTQVVSPGPQVPLRVLAYDLGALGVQSGRSTASLDGTNG